MRMLVVVLLACCGSVSASAQADGLYGRLDGDLMLSIGLGAGASVASAPRLLGIGELRARYLDMAGLVLAAQSSVDSHELVLAADVRPLFPARFLLGGSSYDPWLDLLIESVGLELGVAFVAGAAGAGVVLAWGAGLEIPLLLPAQLVDGLTLRVGLRHLSSGSRDRAAPAGPSSEWQLGLVLTLRVGADAGLAADEPPRYR